MYHHDDTNREDHNDTLTRPQRMIQSQQSHEIATQKLNLRSSQANQNLSHRHIVQTHNGHEQRRTSERKVAHRPARKKNHESQAHKHMYYRPYKCHYHDIVPYTYSSSLSHMPLQCTPPHTHSVQDDKFHRCNRPDKASAEPCHTPNPPIRRHKDTWKVHTFHFHTFHMTAHRCP